jgi:hypothetical protein
VAQLLLGRPLTTWITLPPYYSDVAPHLFNALHEGFRVGVTVYLVHICTTTILPDDCAFFLFFLLFLFTIDFSLLHWLVHGVWISAHVFFQILKIDI